MKRVISLILLFASVLLLASCGAEDYKYTQVGKKYYNNSMLVNYNCIELTNGALLRVSINELYKESFSENDPNFALYCLFDEETKTMFPLCFNAVCTHESSDCFARNFYTAGNVRSFGIYEDEVYALTDFFQGESVDISVCFMSLDGTVQRKIIIDESELLETVSDEEIVPGLLGVNMVTYGNTLYFSAIDNIEAMKFYPSGSEETITHWILSFDLETEEFGIVATLEMPNTVNQTMLLYIGEGSIMVNAEGRAYAVNLETGEQRTVDHAQIVSDMIDEKILPKGGQVGSYYLVNKDLVYIEHKSNDYVRTSYYVDPETVEIVELSDFERAEAAIYMRQNFCCEGVLYIYGGSDGEFLTYYNGETEEKISVDHRFGGNKITSGVYATSENGVIIKYNTIGEDGIETPIRETVTENGVEVTYYTSDKYAYVTKQDFLDGTIDSPLFYNIETGVFSE